MSETFFEAALSLDSGADCLSSLERYYILLLAGTEIAIPEVLVNTQEFSSLA
jgi:hypothetical protein